MPEAVKYLKSKGEIQIKVGEPAAKVIRKALVRYSRRCSSGRSKGMPQVPSIAGLKESTGNVLEILIADQLVRELNEVLDEIR